MITLDSPNLETIKEFESIKPGMKLQCTYKLQDKRYNMQDSKELKFSGSVIQKTKYLIVVRDIRTKLVHCLSVFDCICGYGKYKILT